MQQGFQVCHIHDPDASTGKSTAAVSCRNKTQNRDINIDASVNTVCHRSLSVYYCSPTGLINHEWNIDKQFRAKVRLGLSC